MQRGAAVDGTNAAGDSCSKELPLMAPMQQAQRAALSCH